MDTGRGERRADHRVGTHVCVSGAPSQTSQTARSGWTFVRPGVYRLPRPGLWPTRRVYVVGPQERRVGALHPGGDRYRCHPSPLTVRTGWVYRRAYGVLRS